MAVSTDSTNRLGCGRDIDDVWATIDRPPSAHERQCPYCQEARASLGRLNRVIDAQRRADAAQPDLQPGPQVLSRVMEIARAEVRRGRRLPLDEPVADGTVSDLSVSEQTVAAAVRRAGDAVPGVEVRRCRVELGDPRALSDQRAESTDQWAGSTEQGESTERAGSTPSSDHPYPDDPSREDPGPGEERSGAADLVDVPESYRTTRPSRVAVFLQISVSVAVAIPVVSELIRQAVRRAVFEEVGMNVVTVDIDVRDVHDA